MPRITIQQQSRHLFQLLGIGLLALVVAGAVVAAALMSREPLTLLAIPVFYIAIFVYMRPMLGLYLIVPSLFLESDYVSLFVYGAKIRAYHVIAIILAARLIVDLISGNKHWKKTILDWPLGVYLGINVLAAIISPYAYQSYKTLGLIALLVLLMVVLYQMDWTTKKFITYIRFTIGVALLETGIGLYQFFSYAWNALTQIHIPTFPQIHSDILPFGRPYGTFVEPDWYGMMTAMFFLFTLTLVMAKKPFANKPIIIGALLVFLTGNILSVTRASWIGIITSIVVLILFHKKLFGDAKRPSILNYRFLSTTIIIGALVGIVMALLVPQIQTVISTRSLSVFNPRVIAEEPRVLIMQDAITHIIAHPFIGNGPGSYNVFGITPYVQEQFREQFNVEPFLMNFPLTLLNDTGLIGFVAFMVFAYRFSMMTRAALAKRDVDSKLQLIFLGIVVVLTSLVIMFQISTGFWLGITWFFIALAMIAMNLINKQQHEQVS